MRTPLDTRIPFLATIFLGSFALAGCTAAPSESDKIGHVEEALSSSMCPAGVPATLRPEPDQRLWFMLHGVGSQIYTCNGTAWVFKAPEANLKTSGGDVVGTHFAGPTWEFNDGSMVVAAVVPPTFTPDPSAIPWLVLRAVSHPGVDGKMTDVTSIQRLSTVGGIAPPSTAPTICDADHVGNDVHVPYSADYFFYKTSDGNPDNNPQCGG